MKIRRTQFKENGIDVETSLEDLRIIGTVPHLHMNKDNEHNIINNIQEGDKVILENVNHTLVNLAQEG